MTLHSKNGPKDIQNAVDSYHGAHRYFKDVEKNFRLFKKVDRRSFNDPE
jgi:hypothetical protein